MLLEAVSHEPPQPRSPPELAQDLSRLIGLIYDTASEPAAWRSLLDTMGHSAMDSAQAHPWLTDALLLPHFAQAQRLQGDLDLSHQGLELLDQTINRLPVGVAIVDRLGRLQTANALLMQLLAQQTALFLQSSTLQTKPPSLLTHALQALHNRTQAQACVRLGSATEPLALTLWLNRLDTPRQSEPFFLVVVASRQSRVFSLPALQQLFHFTQAEAKLVQQLLLGLGTEEAAVQLGLSINTVKTQLKQVFIKCGVKRQAELLQAIYNSPLWLTDESLSPPSAATPVPVRPSRVAPRDETPSIVLADGRRLAFADRGDPQGVPLLFNRGLFGSRHSASPDEHMLWDKGIRLLVPDRPGCGLSDPAPGRTHVHWAADVQALLQQLQLPAVVAMGFATGAAYALACAHQCPQHIKAAVLVGAAPPVLQWSDWRWYAKELKHGLMLCRYSPSMAPHVSALLTKNIEQRVHQYLLDVLANHPLDDQQAFDNPDIRQREAQAILDGAAHGNSSLVDEMTLAANPWGFELSEIEVPVSFWHGELDPVVSAMASKHLAATCKQGQFKLVPQAGEYLIYHHWSALLDEVKRLFHVKWVDQSPPPP